MHHYVSSNKNLINCKFLIQLDSTQTPIFKAQEENAKSYSRSPSPQIPMSMHQWYYQKVGDHPSESKKTFKSQKDLWKYILNNSSNLNWKSKEKVKRKQKLTTCNSKDKHISNKAGKFWNF